LRGRIAGPELDQSAAEEVAAKRAPFAALPSPPGFLSARDQPVALDAVLRCEEIGVGRAGALDNADAAQKIDPAARSA